MGSLQNTTRSDNPSTTPAEGRKPISAASRKRRDAGQQNIDLAVVRDDLQDDQPALRHTEQSRRHSEELIAVPWVDDRRGAGRPAAVLAGESPPKATGAAPHRVQYPLKR